MSRRRIAYDAHDLDAHLDAELGPDPAALRGLLTRRFKEAVAEATGDRPTKVEGETWLCLYRGGSGGPRDGTGALARVRVHPAEGPRSGLDYLWSEARRLGIKPAVVVEVLR